MALLGAALAACRGEPAAGAHTAEAAVRALVQAVAGGDTAAAARLLPGEEQCAGLGDRALTHQCVRGAERTRARLPQLRAELQDYRISRIVRAAEPAPGVIGWEVFERDRDVPDVSVVTLTHGGRHFALISEPGRPALDGLATDGPTAGEADTAPPRGLPDVTPPATAGEPDDGPDIEVPAIVEE